MTADTLQDVLHSFANRSAVRFLIRQGAAELATIDPATGQTHAWPVRLRPTSDGAFVVQGDDDSLLPFVRRGLAFGLTSEAPTTATAGPWLDEAGMPTEDAVRRVQSWVDLALTDPPMETSTATNAAPTSVRLTLRDARVQWQPGLAC